MYEFVCHLCKWNLVSILQVAYCKKRWPSDYQSSIVCVGYAINSSPGIIDRPPLGLSEMFIRKIQKAQPIVPRYIVYAFAYVMADVIHNRFVDTGHFIRFQSF